MISNLGLNYLSKVTSLGLNEIALCNFQTILVYGFISSSVPRGIQIQELQMIQENRHV